MTAHSAVISCSNGAYR